MNSISPGTHQVGNHNEAMSNREGIAHENHVYG